MGVKSSTTKIADDRKTRGWAICEQDSENIQRDYDKLEQWSEKCPTVDKCKFMHYTDKKTNHECIMLGKPLSYANEETDLGVYL